MVAYHLPGSVEVGHPVVAADGVAYHSVVSRHYICSFVHDDNLSYFSDFLIVGHYRPTSLRH